MEIDSGALIEQRQLLSCSFPFASKLLRLLSSRLPRAAARRCFSSLLRQRPYSASLGAQEQRPGGKKLLDKT